jgi:hypothetical protein
MTFFLAIIHVSGDEASRSGKNCTKLDRLPFPAIIFDGGNGARSSGKRFG